MIVTLVLLTSVHTCNATSLLVIWTVLESQLLHHFMRNWCNKRHRPNNLTLINVIFTLQFTILDRICSHDLPCWKADGGKHLWPNVTDITVQQNISSHVDTEEFLCPPPRSNSLLRRYTGSHFLVPSLVIHQRIVES
jgi:hypothetical protein